MKKIRYLCKKPSVLYKSKRKEKKTINQNTYIIPEQYKEFHTHLRTVMRRMGILKGEVDILCKL